MSSTSALNVVDVIVNLCSPVYGNSSDEHLAPSAGHSVSSSPRPPHWGRPLTGHSVSPPRLGRPPLLSFSVTHPSQNALHLHFRLVHYVFHLEYTRPFQLTDPLFFVSSGIFAVHTGVSWMPGPAATETLSENPPFRLSASVPPLDCHLHSVSDTQPLQMPCAQAHAHHLWA